MKVELIGFTNYFSVEDKQGNEYTVVMMGDENSKSFNWEVFNKDDTKPIGKKMKNKIIEEVISFEEKKAEVI